METWEVLLFQALAIPYLLYLNQMVVLLKMDFLQQSIMVIHIWISNNTFRKTLYTYSKIKNSIGNTLSLVNCATVSNAEVGFCNCNTCSENEGDCDAHDECQDGLFCGSNNCPVSLGYGSEVDCCTKGKIRKYVNCTWIYVIVCSL